MTPDLSGTTIVITREGMGEGPAELRMKLLATYLRLLVEGRMHPGTVCFYTDGVRLLTGASPVLDQLRALEAQGVHLIACKTCLDYFGLTEQVRIGVVGGMADIQAAMFKASMVISL